MQRLFVKIWLWFWVATVLLGTAVLLAQRQWGGFGTDERFGELLSVLGQAGIAVMDQRGADGFERWRENAEERLRAKLFILNQQGEDVAGRVLPDSVQEALGPLADHSDLQRLGPRERILTVMLPPPAEQYRAIAFIPDGAHRLFDLPGWQKAAIAAAVSGLVCLALAHYLSRPVRRVRAATRRLAEGDLEVRVGPHMGRRRDEMAQLGHDFDVMAERLQALLEAQTRLLRDVSHELRSPLGRLHVALELARQRVGEAGDEVLDRIEREAERLDGLVGQVLSLARLDSGAVTPVREEVDLVHLIGQVVEDAGFEARTSAREVKANLPESAWMVGDTGWLRSAVENAVRNAVRHTPEDTAVEVSLRRRDTVWEIRVGDYGSGVPEDELGRLFEPFFRVSEARDRASGGYGLGLAITRRVVRAHGGDVAASNRCGGGLEIVMQLPAATPTGGGVRERLPGVGAA